MKTRTLGIVLTLSIGLFAACTDKKKVAETVEVEIIAEESKAAVKEALDKEEKRLLDSIQQVKEHGHAH